MLDKVQGYLSRTEEQDEIRKLQLMFRKRKSIGKIGAKGIAIKLGRSLHLLDEEGGIWEGFKGELW